MYNEDENENWRINYQLFFILLKQLNLMETTDNKRKVEDLHIKRMHELMGTEPHPIDRSVLEKLSSGEIHEVVKYQGKDIAITFRIRALARKLLDIIDKRGWTLGIKM